MMRHNSIRKTFKGTLTTTLVGRSITVLCVRHLFSHAQQGLRWLGSKTVASIQTDYAARVYYNTLIPFEGSLVKYGVITVKDLISDLTHWDSLYLSGRLHKPVKFFSTTVEVADAQAHNLNMALAAARLTLPAAFTEVELFNAIAVISYAGDPRMIAGENPDKVRNIVAGNIEGFTTLYTPLLRLDPTITVLGSGRLEQDTSGKARARQLQRLPSRTVSRIEARLDPARVTDPANYVLRPDFAQVLQDELRGIVGPASTTQTLKGIATAGLVKTVRYALEKLGKMASGYVSRWSRSTAAS
eukprot:m.75642 g.75642  ORF g.75642 m.75642 type:complete len:300 (+) comp13139_c0_seq4:234-1133(+)